MHPAVTVAGPPRADAGLSLARLTAADVAVLPRRLATTEVDYELHDGRLIVMAPPGYIHGVWQSQLARVLGEWARRHGGVALTEVGVLLRRDPDHLLGADVAFLTASQLPPRLSPEGYLLTIPALVVEIRSKNDTAAAVEAKVRDYLAAGAAVVWVADPESRTVAAYGSDGTMREYGVGEELTAAGVLPGLAIPVAELLPPGG